MKKNKFEELKDFAAGRQETDKRMEKEKVGTENVFAIGKQIENSRVPGLKEIGITYGKLFEEYKDNDEKGKFKEMNIVEFKDWYDERNQIDDNNNKNEYKKTV